MIPHSTYVVLKARVPFLPTSSASPRRRSGLSGDERWIRTTKLRTGARPRNLRSWDHRNVECVTKLLHEEEKITALLKHDWTVLLRGKREGVKDTSDDAPHIKDSFQGQRGSVIGARAILLEVYYR